MVLSAILVRKNDRFSIETEFEQARGNNGLHPTNGEMKWTKISPAKIAAYEAIVDKFFELMASDHLRFHSIVIDSRRLNHAQYNGSDPDVGYSKMLYQLLMSIVRKTTSKDGSPIQYYVHLDDRTTKQTPDDLRVVVNNGLQYRWGIAGGPVRRVTFADSKKTTLLQVNDIILGAIAFHKNGRDSKEGVSPAKLAIARRICGHLGCDRLGLDTPPNRRFNVWCMRLR